MKQLKQNHFYLLFFGVFIAAIAIRVFFINWTLQFWNNGDFTRYEDWARVAHTYTLANTYVGNHSTTVVNNEPPGTLYTVAAFYETYIFEGKIVAKITHAPMGSILWVNTYLQHITMKMLPFVTDLLIGFFIFSIVAKFTNKKRGLFAASIFLLNPIVFYNSAIWGQMDSVNNFFFILSLFFAFRKHTILSILAYAASLYIKLSLLPLLPFYFIFMFFILGKNLKRILVGIGLSLAMIILATIPISLNPVQWLVTQMPILAQGELQNITVVAFNFWYMVTCSSWFCSYPTVTQTFLGITLNIWAYGLFGLFSLPLLYLQIKKSKILAKPQHITLLLSVVALFVFLFLPKMHDRYMYPVFPLLAIAIGLSKNNKWIFVVYVLLSLFHLENLIYSWFPTPMNAIIPFYALFYDMTFRWVISLLTVVVGVGLYIRSVMIYSHSTE